MEPVALGLNVALIVQLDPAATLPPQLLLCRNWSAFVPVIEMTRLFSVVFPVFERVTP